MGKEKRMLEGIRNNKLHVFSTDGIVSFKRENIVEKERKQKKNMGYHNLVKKHFT